MTVKTINTLIMLAPLLLVANTVLAQKLYRWVDEEGNIHYSDKIPAEVSKRAHATLNKQGVILNEKRSETEVQQESDQKAKELEQRRIKAAKAARQRHLDQNLLDTFTTEKDLLLMRDDKLNMIDSIVNLTVNNNQILNKQIEATRKKIKFLESRNKGVPDNTKKKLENLEGQKEKNLAFINAKKAERKQLEEQFEKDLARYRKLQSDESDEQVLDSKAENPEQGKSNTASVKDEATALNDDP